jgi:cell division inhibitor SulA
MSTLKVELHPSAESVTFTNDEMIVALIDGRSISVPLAWFPTLSTATRAQLEHYELLGDGDGIHWPELDEDLSIRGLLQGTH